MKKQTTLLIAGLTLTMLMSPILASAETLTPGATKTANQSAKLAEVISRSDTAISQRLTSLTTDGGRLNGLAKLSSTQKAQFGSEITTDVNGLTTLKTKADGDTDLTTARTDYKTIFTTYRVYAEFLPQLNLLIASDTMGTSADKLSDLATKLQARISAAGNPTNLTGLLSEMQTKIADARTQYQNVESQVTPLTPQSYDSNPTGTTATLKNARTEIQTGATDLKTAFADAKQIIQALKSVSTTPTPTPHP